MPKSRISTSPKKPLLLFASQHHFGSTDLGAEHRGGLSDSLTSRRPSIDSQSRRGQEAVRREVRGLRRNLHGFGPEDRAASKRKRTPCGDLNLPSVRITLIAGDAQVKDLDFSEETATSLCVTASFREYRSRGRTSGRSQRLSNKPATVDRQSVEKSCLLYTSPSPRD